MKEKKVLLIEILIAVGVALWLLLMLLLALPSVLSDRKQKNAADALKTAYQIVYVSYLEDPPDGYLVYYETAEDLTAADSFSGLVCYIAVRNGRVVQAETEGELFVVSLQDKKAFLALLEGYTLKNGIGMIDTQTDLDLTKLQVSYYTKK